MNDDDPAMTLEALKAEHRDLDERIRVLSSEPTVISWSSRGSSAESS